jgi:hypothetical protein
MDAPKFIQIATGQWKGTNGDFNHAVYGLSADGKVYKFFANEGWTLMRGRNEAQPQTRRPVTQLRNDVTDDDVPY